MYNTGTRFSPPLRLILRREESPMPKDDYASAALLERWITHFGDMLVRLA